MHSDIDTEIDLEFEYKEEQLKFQAVPITGTVDSGLATYWETSWCEVKLHIGMTAEEIQDWLVEMFEDDDHPVPSWAYTDGEAIRDEMKEHIDLG